MPISPSPRPAGPLPSPAPEVQTEDAGPAEAAALAPFRSRIFLALWVASLLSNFGSLIQNVGAAWLMTSLAPSADMVALVQVATVLPIMLLSLPAGAAADVWDRRRVMLAAQVAMLVVSVALAALAWLGTLTPWVLIAITFLIGAGAAMFGPAWQSSVREQVPRRDLPAAVALNGVSYNLARAVGPALGGVLVAFAGAPVAFVINAVSYVGLIVVLLGWRRSDTPAALPPETLTGAMLAGLRFARLSHALQAVLIRSAAFGFFAAALWAMLPLVSRDILGGGAITYGLLLAAFGIGAVGGALFGSRIRARQTSERIVAGGCLAFAGAGLVVALGPGLAPTLAGLLVAGAAWLLVLSTFNVTVQLRSPRWVVGRAMAIYQASVFGALALGAWLWGVAAERYGVPIGLGAASLGLAASAIVGRVLPMPATDVVDLEPAEGEGAPGPRLEGDVGPVVTSTAYRIAGDDVGAFLAVSRRLRRMRGRNGARRWALLHDVVDPEVWLERFETPTWLDYLRLRDRMTVTDRAVEGEVLALHGGGEPPVVRHLLAHIVPDTARRAHDATPVESSVFDPNLPPALRAAR